MASFTRFNQDNTTLINGRAKSFKNDVSNILIVNLNSKKSTIIDFLGLFTIEAKLKEVTVTPHNLTGKLDLDAERLGIKPVVTSSTLGLPNADVEVEVMTQNQRLLLEADRGKYIRLATIEDQGRLIAALGYLYPTIIINTSITLRGIKNKKPPKLSHLGGHFVGLQGLEP